jgi:ParB family transcriptional regulator, chromosome partitioning protein
LSQTAPYKRIAKEIPLEKLALDSDGNVRKTDVYGDVEDLAESIRENGLLNPLIVKKDPNEDRYLVVSGQRRLQACRMIPLKMVSCFVYEDIDLTESRIISLSENLYRKDMNADDISVACEYLYKQLHNLTTVAKRLGVSVPTVKKYLGYVSVTPELKDLVRQKQLTPAQAISIYTQFPEVAKQLRIAREYSNIKSRDEQTKFFQAVRESSPKDDVSEIKQRAKRIAELKEYKIILPPKSSKIIEKLAIQAGVQPVDIIVQIIEEWAAAHAEPR